jgi:hypothetical protein
VSCVFKEVHHFSRFFKAAEVMKSTTESIYLKLINLYEIASFELNQSYVGSNLNEFQKYIVFTVSFRTKYLNDFSGLSKHCKYLLEDKFLTEPSRR